MKALVFNIRVNSLYSIRIPYTWQSALTYPVLPPSAIIGMLANALQRYKNDKHPLKYLDLIEKEILWAGSQLLTPCVIKSYTTSAITKWESSLPWKFTNALGRQFAYSRQLQVVAVFQSDTLIAYIVQAVKTTPLTCGDSESPVSLEDDPLVKDVVELTGRSSITTKFPVPFDKDTKIDEGNGKLYLIHERCKKQDDSFPLYSYMIPVREEGKILIPSYLTVAVSKQKVLEIKDIGYVVMRLIEREEKKKEIKRKSRKRHKE